MLKLYGDRSSNDCYKVRLLFSLLKKNYDWIPLEGETKAPLNVYQQYPKVPLPILEEDGGLIVEANAILYAVAQESRYLPESALGRARCLQWLFFERGQLQPAFEHGVRQKADPAAGKVLRQALGSLEYQFAQTRFAVGNQVSVADIALFVSVFKAADAGIDIKDFPQICLWLEDIQALNGYKTKESFH
jgi:glutathione S-transferase